MGSPLVYHRKKFLDSHVVTKPTVRKHYGGTVYVFTTTWMKGIEKRRYDVALQIAHPCNRPDNIEETT